MKTLIGLIGSIGSKVTALELIKPVKVVSILAPLTTFLPEVFRISQESFNRNEPFREPILLQEHHIRHFFSKIVAGVAPVQGFIGKTISDPTQAITYYRDTVIPKALGGSWLFDKFVKDFDDEDAAGIYVLNEPSFLPYAKQLKSLYLKNFDVLVLDDETSTSNDLPTVDVAHNVIKFKSKTALKKDLALLIKQTKGKTNERSRTSI
jgi:hypothetical protein